MENKELYHHGIKGMRWGVRRYQNKDGTLTAKGKKRYASEIEKLKKEEAILKNKKRTQAKIEKLLQKQKELEDIKTSLSKKQSKSENESTVATSKNTKANRFPDVKSLSDTELKSMVTRLENEQKYKKYARDFEQSQKTRGKKFVDTVLDKVIIPAALDVGQKVAKDILTDLANNAKKKKGNP